MFKDDFDSEMDELQQEVDEMAKDLDEAAKDLDEDLRRDKNDYDELHSIRKRGNSYLTDDQKDEMDDLAENILDVVSDFQKD